ncbi:MAG: hypothetical protein K2Z81_16875 [Cyanobacteria bacterium]|nr:hypothetical protein [Cyanobacteriota bacterium]
MADNYVQQIQKLSNDEFFSENSGLSKKDLEKLANADRRDYPFVEEFDKALAAFGKLTIEGIHDPNSIACDLLEGNGMSLELGLNNRNGFEDKAVLMAQVNKQISDLRAERSTLPTLRAEAWRDPFRRGDWVYSVINEKRGVPIYEQQFCPHNGNIYNARFRLVNPFNPR